MSIRVSDDPATECADGVSRRTALRRMGGAGLAAMTAAAVTGETRAQATPAAQLDACAFGRAEFDIELVDDIKLDTVHELVGRLVDAAGCPACGFLGLDLRLRGAGPQPEPWLLDAPVFQFGQEDFPGVIDHVALPQDPIAVREGIWGTNQARFDVVFEDGISLDSVRDFIAKHVDAAGCSGCGFMGLDDRFRVAGPQPDPWAPDARVFDPELVNELGSISEVAGLGVRGIAEFGIQR